MRRNDRIIAATMHGNQSDIDFAKLSYHETAERAASAGNFRTVSRYLPVKLRGKAEVLEPYSLSQAALRPIASYNLLARPVGPRVYHLILFEAYFSKKEDESSH